MAIPQATSPPHCQTFLECQGWIFHQIQSTPQGDKSLHSSRVAQPHPCCSAWHTSGNWQDAGPDKRGSVLTQHRCRHSQLSAGAPYVQSTKPLPPVHPMLPRDVPNGHWQEITADYLTHKGREYPLVYNLFSKYPFIYKVSTKFAKSMCMCLQELIYQYKSPALLYTEMVPPSASDEFAQFLQHHHTNHLNSSPHFPCSNGFIECQVHTIKTMLSTSQDSRKSIKDLLPDLQSTPIGPNMPSPGDPS